MVRINILSIKLIFNILIYILLSDPKLYGKNFTFFYKKLKSFVQKNMFLSPSKVNTTAC